MLLCWDIKRPKHTFHQSVVNHDGEKYVVYNSTTLENVVQQNHVEDGSYTLENEHQHPSLCAKNFSSLLNVKKGQDVPNREDDETSDDPPHIVQKREDEAHKLVGGETPVNQVEVVLLLSQGIYCAPVLEEQV